MKCFLILSDAVLRTSMMVYLLCMTVAVHAIENGWPLVPDNPADLGWLLFKP
jgi:hypothetical protein